MAEDDFSGKIAEVEFEFVRPSFNDLFPQHVIYFTCMSCFRKTDQIWFKVQKNLYRGTYCTKCKERKELTKLGKG